MALSGKNRWLLIGVMVVCAQLLAATLIPRGHLLAAWSDLLQLLLVSIVVVGFARNARRTHESARTFWMLMSVGAALWAIVQCFWTGYEVVLNLEVPNLFLGDVVLFLHVVPMMGALAVQPHRKKGTNGISPGTLDLVLLLLWWIYLYVFEVIPWQYLKPNLEFYGSSFNLLYQVEHAVFLLGAAYLFSVSSGKWRNLYRHLLTAGILYSVSSLAIDIAVDLPKESRFYYFSGSLYDLPLLLAMLYWVYVAFLPTRLGDMPAEEEAPKTHSVWSSRVAMFAVLSMPVLGLCVLLFPSTPDPIHTFRLVVTCVAMLVLTALLFLKQRLMDIRLLASLEDSRQAYDDLRALQGQMVQTEKLASIGRLVAGAAHEINNPLTAILGYSDLLAEQADIQDDHREMATKIRQQARRTKTLVSNLLTFAKQSSAERTQVDVNEIVIRALKLHELDLAHKNIETVTDLDPHLSLVKADENHLLQACVHIFHNAVDAMREAHGEGTLTIGTCMVNGRVALRCADTGPGILDPERIFDPFYTTKALGKGSGLGLSACYGIIRDHGGEITCENLPGGGALFSTLNLRVQVNDRLTLPIGV